MFEMWLLDLMALFRGPYNDTTEQTYLLCKGGPGRAFYLYFSEDGL